MKVAVTCIQLIRDLESYRPELDAAGLEVRVPRIEGQYLAGDELIAALDGCAGVIAGDDRFTSALLQRCPELRAISKWGVGVDGIDLETALARGIRVTNTPGVFDDEVADVSMAYITMLARGLHEIDRGVRSGAWPKPAGRSLRGATLGIVGLGGTGRALAMRASIAGMTVVGTDPSTSAASSASHVGVSVRSFAELLAVSEFVSINCPLNETTFHLFDASAFAQLRRGAFLVSTGRGAVADTDALVEALSSGRIAGAALDVMEEEPPSPDHPLRRFPNVIFGSHNASNTVQASARVHAMAIENLVTSLAAVVRRS